MSERDEPKTALTRLLHEHRESRNDSGCSACRCGWRALVYGSTHFLHLADVLLAEGYTTSPAPEATKHDDSLPPIPRLVSGKAAIDPVRLGYPKGTQ